MTTVIRTNNQRRPVLYWQDLTAKEQAEFDYLDTGQRRDDASFMRYRGWVYDLGEFTRAPDDLKPWEGYFGDSYFSAVVIRYANQCESVIAGLALS